MTKKERKEIESMCAFHEQQLKTWRRVLEEEKWDKFRKYRGKTIMSRSSGYTIKLVEQIGPNFKGITEKGANIIVPGAHLEKGFVVLEDE